MKHNQTENNSIEAQLQDASPIKRPEPTFSGNASAFIGAKPRENVGSKMLETAIENMKNKGNKDD